MIKYIKCTLIPSLRMMDVWLIWTEGATSLETRVNPLDIARQARKRISRRILWSSFLSGRRVWLLLSLAGPPGDWSWISWRPSSYNPLWGEGRSKSAGFSRWPSIFSSILFDLWPHFHLYNCVACSYSGAGRHYRAKLALPSNINLFIHIWLLLLMILVWSIRVT